MPKMVDPLGNPEAKLWVISEAPSKEDTACGVLWSTAQGRELISRINGVGMEPSQVYFASILPTFYSKIDEFLLVPGNAEMVETYASILLERAKKYKPNCILLLGATPLKYFLNKSDVSEWRGHVVMEGGLKYITTYDPQTWIRQRFVHKTQNPGQYAVLAAIDIKKAVEHAAFPEPRYQVSYAHISPTFDEAVDWMDMLYRDATRLSVDIETLGKKSTTMQCIGFAKDASAGYCIPLSVPERSPDGKVITYKVCWDDSQLKVILGKIARLIRSDIPKYAQNSQFDFSVLWKNYGMPVRNLVWDTMVAAHNIACELPKDLGTLISLYTKLPYHKFLYGSGSIAEFWEYNARDASCVFPIADEQMREMKEYGILDHYRRVSNLLLIPLIHIQVRGVLTDKTLRLRTLSMLEQKMWEIGSAFERLLGQKFLPTSPPQVAKLLFEVLKITPIYVNGKPTTGEDILEAIISRGVPKEVEAIIRLILRYREASHLAGVLNTELENDRMHTYYGASGTDTGRLNSKESIFGTGTNMQNLQKGVPRQMLIPG